VSSARTRPPLIEALAHAHAFPDATEPVRVVETHISYVFLTGRHAYKVKKAIELPFLDFRTLADRKRYCDEELRLNRRLAADLYLGVVPIGGTSARPVVGAEPAIEYAVKMVQFPDDARLDRQIARAGVPVEAVVAFADELAAFHARLPELPNTMPPSEEAAIVTQAVRDNVRELGALVEPTPFAARMDALRGWTDAQCERLVPVVARRLAGRAQKECHGDLHLENLLLRDRKIAAFDALEFDPKLREVDVVSEASFAAMDFMAHGRPDFAFAFLARYFEAGGDYDGIDVLRFYLVYRALIRAKVRAVKATQSGEPQIAPLAPYFEVADELIAPRRPLVVITHGLSGSGKTRLSGELVGGLHALRVRSDLERKRLHALDPLASSGSSVGGGIYAEHASAETYERLRAIAATALANDFNIVVDAAFLRRAERDRFRELAAEHAARFAILHCEAAPDLLRARVAARAAAGSDASEAGIAVLEHQLAHVEGLAPEEQAVTVAVDTGMPVDRESTLRRLAASDG
jgi:aminoglycoside phosphotransferase family enzyme/predicted kinase